jgi:hypothetical protein
MAIMVSLVLGWLYLVTRLFRVLRTSHHAKFVEMGEPSFILNNNLRTNISLFRFLFAREDKELGDAALTKLTKFMLAYFLLYLLLFLGIFVAIFAIVGWH